jgi:hypothetical protein
MQAATDHRIMYLAIADPLIFACFPGFCFLHLGDIVRMCDAQGLPCWFAQLRK